MPNLWRLQNVSIRYFLKEVRARLIQLILPRAAVNNTIAALLMPYTFALGAHGYYVNVFKKPE